MQMSERLQSIVEGALRQQKVNLYKTVPSKGYTVYTVAMGGIIPLNMVYRTNRKRASTGTEAQKDWREHRAQLCARYLELVLDGTVRYRFFISQNEYGHRNVFTGKLEVVYETDGSSEIFTVPEHWFSACADYVHREDETAKQHYLDRVKSHGENITKKP